MAYDMGLLYTFPTIIIPALIGVGKILDPNKALHMNSDQASWMG